MRAHVGAAREWLEDEASAAARLRIVTSDPKVEVDAPTPPARPAPAVVATVTPIRKGDGIIYAW
jgi:hypothetical protein